ncbi:MAG TPA: mechanosensitive ion channel family protein [Gemmatimonadota bacterium]|nr:mechanosensitive ion channel family protein [Gemmatimonadota bacterium]
MEIPIESSAQETPPDSPIGSEGLSDAVDRVTEVRSAGDLWELLADFQGELIGFGLKLLLAFVVLAVFVGVYRLLTAGIRPVFERSRLEADATDLLLSILKYGVVGFGLILALDQLGFDVTSLIAGLGIAGLALGFAAKDTLANFIAGITILWDRPFKVGDRVEIDGEFGQVKKITLRSTRIHTNENKVVIIPNQNVTNNKIINHTMQASLRLDIPFGIAYKEDIDEARATILALTADDDRIRSRPAPDVVLTELADSSINLQLRFWLKNPHEEVPLELVYRERIKKALDLAGIEIPFPHLSLFVEKTGPEGGPGEESGKEEAAGLPPATGGRT